MLNIIISILLLDQPAHDLYWPEFRGSNGSGLAEDAARPPVKWSETENIRWKLAIHGKGWSSPVIWKDQVWLTTATEDGKELFAICVDFQSGKILHDIKVFDVAKPEFCHPTNSYASCSPTIEEGRLYVYFGSYGTACLDTSTGKKLWERRDFSCDHFRAPGSSVILFDNLLYLSFDGIDQQYVASLDKKTGDTIWTRKRSTDYKNENGDYKKAYSTPGMFHESGKPILISPGAVATIAYHPKTGDEIWKCYHGGMNASSRVLHSGGHYYLTTGDGGKGLIAIQKGGQGDISATHLKWSLNKAIPKRSSPIIVGQHLFMVSDQGIITCLEVKSGKEVWQKRVNGFNFWASPVATKERIYFPSQEGTTIVISAKGEYEELATNKLETGCNASPALVGDSVVLRTRTHLYRIAEK